MRTIIRALAFSFLFAFLFSSSACCTAEIVFSNGVGGASGMNASFNSNFGSTLWADNFQLGSDETISKVHWTGIYLSNDMTATDSFTITVFDDINGVPGNSLVEFSLGNSFSRTNSGLDFVFGWDIFEYSAEVNFQANEFQDYWLSINNAAPLWQWAGQQGNGDALLTQNGGQSWFRTSANRLDFRLQAIPEPNLVPVVVLIAVFVLSRRKPISVAYRN